MTVMTWNKEFGINVAIYLAIVVFLFCLLPVLCFYVRVENRTLSKLCPPRRRRRQEQRRCRWSQQQCSNREQNDRQGATFEVSEEQSRNRYGDIFFIEPSATDAARIRDDPEKDDRDLPSYDEVMRMCNLSSPTAAPAVSGSNTDPPPLAPVSIAALPAPPYAVTDIVSSYTPVDSSTISRHTTAIQMEPSTSRVYQTPPSTSMVMSLPHTTSNTDV